MFPQIIVTFESCQIIEYIAFRSQYCVTKTGRIDCQADNAIETIFEVEGQRLDFFFFLVFFFLGIFCFSVFLIFLLLSFLFLLFFLLGLFFFLCFFSLFK